MMCGFYIKVVSLDVTFSQWIATMVMNLKQVNSVWSTISVDIYKLYVTAWNSLLEEVVSACINNSLKTAWFINICLSEINFS